jgi:branched-chain amino acid transport system permease protein
LLLAAYVGLPLLCDDYWLNAILIPFLILSLAGLGLNLLTGYTGQTSVGAAGFMAVGAFATYGLLLRVPGIALPLALFGGGLSAAVVGLLFGIPSARIKGFYLMVTTLAAQFFLEWVFSKFPWFYNYASSGTISAPRLEVFGYSLASPVGRYLLTLSCVVLLTWVAVNLVRSQVGRNWMAIRDMDTAASVVGIPVDHYKAPGLCRQLVLPGHRWRALGFCLPGHGERRQLRYQSLVPGPVHHHYRRHGQYRR